jgi:hypothetical protein
VAEGHDDLGPVRPGAQVLDDAVPQAAGGVAAQDRDPLRVEENHPGPADQAAAAVTGGELHHEQISLVVERVGDVVEVRQRFPAQRLQELKVLLAPFEGLLHRDHTVPEHSCLWHE